MKATSSILVFACAWAITAMVAAGVDIDHYYCTKFGDVSAYGQFYVVGGLIPDAPLDSLNLLMSSLDEDSETGDVFSYNQGHILPPSVIYNLHPYPQ